MVMSTLNQLTELFVNVKMEPHKHIGEPDIEKLFAFYLGIRHYFERSEGVLYYPIEGFREFLIKKKFGKQGEGFGAISIVLLHSKDLKDAFYRFYDLFEEFFSIQGKQLKPFQSRKLPDNIYKRVSDDIYPTINEKQENIIWSLISTDRTKIATGKKSLALLEIYIKGVLQGAILNKSKSFDVLPGFDRYLSKRFEECEDMERYQVIKKNSLNDEDAFVNYYLWMYDFLKEKGTLYEPIVKM